MNDQNKPADDLIRFLQEREKELNCLYKIEELLNNPEANLEDVYYEIIKAIPPSWHYPDICQARITVDEIDYVPPDFTETPWVLETDITIQDQTIGCLCVYYTREMPNADQGPFLTQEIKLLDTIADRLGHFIMHKKMKRVFQEYRRARENLSELGTNEWRVILSLLRQTDKNLYLNVCQKMLNHLCWSGIEEAEKLRSSSCTTDVSLNGSASGDDNRPHQKQVLSISENLSNEIFKIAARHISDEQILNNIQKWMRYDKTSFLVKVANRNLSLSEVMDAVRRYRHIAPEGIVLSPATETGIKVSLIRRFFSGQLNYINVAKDYVKISDFYDFLDNIIFSPDSHGKLGGKSAGLFLAEHIIKKSLEDNERGQNIKIPKTWYITSDVLLKFLSFNNLDEVVEQKYKDINQVRLEYPHVVQTFKNSHFPPEIIQGLSMALDDFEQRPLIVRSSSLLEDRLGAAFSGKYKSLFIANQGSKQERLAALTDAIAEVYASTFGPDPIEYRTERGLIDFAEEMGIMIQEVVGHKIGYYFLPLFAGVAFSRNEFRWSPRIKRQDGLIRMVPGLGTRAVDRVSDDYPVLIAPGQPDLRANVTTDEVIHYSPSNIDLVNLKTNTFETVKVGDLLRQFGQEIPNISKIISIYDGQNLRRPFALNVDFEKDDLVITFDGLVSNSPFVKQMYDMLKLLEATLETPVDIEFAHDGQDFYLLQCRPQSYSEDSVPAPIPTGLPKSKIVFSANRYISNGRVPDITHIVYVDPARYGDLSDKESLLAVGRAVSRLNKLLPKRQFILMGPGRWGSRGDIKLGVNVTYSDINNTAVLIEIARKKGNYLPDLSFGTHFFQDLVEARIRYLPLYPDDKDIDFNERFLLKSPNILGDIVPEYKFLSDTVRLIDVPQSTNGSILRILMNAEQNKAVGILSELGSELYEMVQPEIESIPQSDNCWAWRLRMSEHIASQLNPVRFGVKGYYIFGSTKNATAGPKSDIDLLIHFVGTEKQREDLMIWLEGWSLCLAEMNYFRTGYKTNGLLDVHIVTDEDIASKTSYAAKIGAVTDAARPIALKAKK